MSITRIQNNQITDSTIVGYAKLQAGSLTGNLFAPTVTLNSNVTINGNLFLANTGNITTVNATNTFVNDPVVVFNNGYAGSLTGYDIGILVNRNLTSLAPYGSVNTFFGWVEADQAFEAIATTDTGTGITSINNSGYANVKIGNLTSVSESISGFLTVGGAATITGAAQINNSLGVTGAVAITDSTASTSSTTGALKVTGGAGFGGNINAAGNSSIGGRLTVESTDATTGVNTGALQVTSGGAYIAGNLWVGGNINFTPNAVNTISGNSAQFFGNAAGFGALYAGISSGFVFQPQTVLQNSTNFNSWAQVNHQNINGGIQATSDYVATADTGTASTNYIDLGIASSGYVNSNPNNSLGTSLFPLDGYLYAQGTNAGSAGGNLVVGTTVPGTVTRILVGGVNIANVVTTFTNSGLTVNAATASSSTSTGALVVAGGAGIAGAAYIGGLVNAAGAATLQSTLNVTGATTLTTATTGGLQAVAIGNVTPGTAVFTTASTDGLQAVAIGNVTPGTGAFTTLTATNYSTANAQITGGNVTGLTNLNSTTGTIANFASSNVQITGGYLNGLSGGTGSTSSGTTQTLRVSGGGIAVTGDSYLANSLGINQNLSVTGWANIAGATVLTTATTGGLQAVAIGNVTPGTGAFTTLSATGATTLNTVTAASYQGIIGNATPAAGTFTAANSTVANITGTTTSTSSTTGALVVAGGVGTAGNIVSGGQIQAANGLYSLSTFNGGYADGIVVDYVSTNGRISVGSADGITFYNGGVANTQLFAISSTGAVTAGPITGASFNGIIGNVTPATATFTTATTGGLQAVAIGNVTPGTAVFTTATTGGLQAVAIGNVTPGTGAFTSVTANTETVGGLQAVAIGNVTPGTAAFTTLSATGASTLNTVTAASYQGIIGNATPAAATFTSVTAQTETVGGLQAVAIGNVTPGTAVFTTATTGGLQAVAIGNATPGTGAFTTLSATGATTLNTITGASFQGPVGNATPNTGAFTTLSASGITQVTNNTQNNGTTYSSGALQVTGGAGFGANVYIGGNLIVAGNVYEVSTEIITGNEIVAGTITANSGTASTSTTTGALLVNGGVGVTGAIYAGSIQNTPIGSTTASTGAFTTLSATDASTLNTVTAASYQGIIGNATPATATFTTASVNTTLTAQTVNAATIGNSGATLTGTLSTAAQTNVTSLGTLTGLTVSGTTALNTVTGASFQGIIGNATPAAGTFTTLNATTLTTPAINNTVIGNTGATTGYFTTLTATTVNAATIGNSGTVLYGTLNSASASQTNITAVGTLTGLTVSGSTSLNTTTGASFQGIIGNVTPAAGTFTSVTAQTETVGGLQAVAIGNVTPGTAVFTTTSVGGLQAVAIGNATPGTGAFTTLSTSGVLTSTSNIVAAASTPSTTTTTGALIVPNGGVGITGNLNVGTAGTSIHQLLGNVVIGTGDGAPGATAALTINETNAQPFTTTSTVHVIGKTDTTAKITIDSIGGDQYTTALYVARSASGTPTSPVAANIGDILGGFVVRGYGATKYNIANVASTAGMLGVATQQFTDAAQGTLLQFNVIPDASLNAITGMILGNSGQLNITQPISSVSTSTGALVVSTGGAGIAGNVYVGAALTVNSGALIGGNTYINGTARTTSSSTGALVVTGGVGVSGNVNVGTQLYVGQNSQATNVTSPTAVFTGTSPTGAGTQYSQIGLFNKTSTGSSDFIAYANNYPGPSNDHGWVDVGFTGDAFNDLAYTITKPNDAYLFGSAANATVGGNLVLATDYSGSFNDIVLGVGSFLAESEVARFHGNVSTSGYLNLAYTTSASSTTTGALRVAGGVGVAGAVYAGSIQGTPIGSTTASTGVFTTLTAQTETIGGLQAVAIGNVTPGTAVFTTASTGGLQAVAIGNATPGTAAFTTLSTSGVTTHAGNVVITSGVDTVSTTTGALMLTGSGGAMIGGNAYVGNNLYIGPNSFSQTFAAPTIVAVDNGVNYAQIALKNTNSAGSADYAAYGDTGTDASGWADMGFAGSAFADGNYTITKPNDGYFIVKPTSSSYGGNLVLATSEFGASNDVVIGVGAFHANAEVARFRGNSSTSGTFVLKLPTNAAPAANTGAFQVWGGSSISANSYVGGAMTINGSQTAGNDVLVKGKNDSTLIWARPNATYDSVVIGGNATVTQAVAGAKLVVNSTDTMLLPVGSTAQRPSAVGQTDVAGMMRFNTTLGSIEFYTGPTNGWQGTGGVFTIIADEQFTGTGSQTQFTLTHSATTNGCMVSINGVLQLPTLAYSVTGLTLTFTEAPMPGELIDVRIITTTQTVTEISSDNGFVTLDADNDGVNINSGPTTKIRQYTFNTSGAMVTVSPNVTVSTASVATTVDALYANTYSSAEYTITATLAGTKVRQIDKVHLLHDGDASSAGTVTVVVYGTINTAGNSLVTYSATAGGNIALLQATTTNNDTILRIKRDYQAI